MQDAVSKRRMAYGVRNSRARFTTIDVLTMRQRRAMGEPLAQIAVAYQTSYNTVYRIVTRQAWPHLP